MYVIKAVRFNYVLYSFLSPSTSGKNTSILLSNKEKEKKREASAFVCTSSSGWNGGNRERGNADEEIGIYADLCVDTKKRLR